MYTLDLRTPAAAGFAMPPEWAPHAGCLMAFPCRATAYRGCLAAARAATAAVAHAIAEFEPVTLVVHPDDEQAAKKLFAADTTILPLPIDDAWMRDSAPTYVVDTKGGEVAGVDWLFNAWGGKYTPYDKDDALAAALLRCQQRRRFLAPLVMEGGSFHTNGAGVILTTEQCLLNENRNPRLNKDDIEQLLCAYLGGREVLWLRGDLRDDETDGHVDNIACFADETQVLLMYDKSDATLRENHRRLQQARTSSGGTYEVIMLPRPQVLEESLDLLASYINFYFANGGIIMPSFGAAEDREAAALMADIFPQRKIVVVAANDIVRGGGGIHCITQQIPASAKS